MSALGQKQTRALQQTEPCRCKACERFPLLLSG